MRVPIWSLEAVRFWRFVRQAVRAVIIASPLISLGCNRPGVGRDNSQMVVTPGLGISNLCEIGMNFTQIQAASPDARTYGLGGRIGSQNSWSDGRFALIPSLGAITFLGTNEPVGIIEFYVRPDRGGIITGLEVREPFRGRIGSVLDLRDHRVSGQDVATAFGSVAHIATNAQASIELLKRGECFRLSRTASVEEIWYPQAGIAFVLESNVVHSCKVFPKRAPETKGHPDK
jgi:hypothetical protein